MQKCDRCFKDTFSTIMSMFNTQIICPDCKEKETKRSDYKQAEARDLNEYAGRLRGLGMGIQAVNVENLAKSILEGASK